MIAQDTLFGEQIYLHTLSDNDVTDRYVIWLADPEVNHHLETRFKQHTKHNILEFVQNLNQSKDSYLFGIFCKDTKLHIGNIKIGPINFSHLCADISFFIGDKNYWSQGITTEAVDLVVQFGFKNLNLHRLQAGFISTNLGKCACIRTQWIRYRGLLPTK